MRIAITGGTGFVGRHLARRLTSQGHQVVLLARGFDRRDPGIFQLPGATFFASGLGSVEELERAFAGCDAVAHCAGINREIGRQTYRKVHVEATAHVIVAAHRAGVRKIVLLSFLRARPGCGSAYHESKWGAEEIVRRSGLDYTIVKAGMIYGRGDHMLDHLSHAFHTFPVLPTVGMKQLPIRPLAIDDLLPVLEAALVEDRLSRRTVPITGAEELLLSDAARRVARVLGRKILVFPLPLWMHQVAARVFELAMKIPLVARAQVRILSEGVTQAAPPFDELPPDLAPRLHFTDEQIRRGLPEPGRFGLRDLRCCWE
jgi:NADH dehydrogenase